MVPPLDDLEEERRSIFEWLCEDLKEVALVVIIDEDFLSLQNVDVFLHLQVDIFETLT